jgi:hypothetical protein
MFTCASSGDLLQSLLSPRIGFIGRELPFLIGVYRR